MSTDSENFDKRQLDDFLSNLKWLTERYREVCEYRIPTIVTESTSKIAEAAAEEARRQKRLIERSMMENAFNFFATGDYRRSVLDIGTSSHTSD